MRIIFGGSFDPIHNGHIAMMKYLYQHFPLHKIMVMPNRGNLGYKPSHFFSDKERRDMVDIVINKYPQMCELCDLELRSSQYTPTFNSIKSLHEIYPQDMLYFVLGYDSFLSLYNWDNWQELCKIVNFIVFSRESISMQLPVKLQNHLTVVGIDDLLNETNYGRVSFANMLNIDISSTKIRQTMKSDASAWEKMVDLDVAAYIKNIIK